MDTVETNLVLTVFGKDNYMNYFQGALTPDKIVYIDKKQGQKLERLAERQLFGNYSSLDPYSIIHLPPCSGFSYSNQELTHSKLRRYHTRCV